jgi:sigma-E factor negative regulatory protein RseA
MDTKESVRQEISAFADGELHKQEIDSVLAALRHDEGKEDWKIYHQIGDLLRSDDMNINLSPGFSSRMAARLEAEAPILAPQPTAQPGAKNAVVNKRQPKYWFASGMAAAGVALAAFLGLPQLIVTTSQAPTSDGPMLASVSPPAGDVSNGEPLGTSKVAGKLGSNSGAVVLRDPRIDEYLSAHHGLSPSFYSATHYARSAIFATDSHK